MKAPALVALVLAMTVAALAAPAATRGAPVDDDWADAMAEDVAPAGLYVTFKATPWAPSVRTDAAPSPGPEVPSPGPEVPSPSPEM